MANRTGYKGKHFWVIHTIPFPIECFQAMDPHGIRSAGGVRNQKCLGKVRPVVWQKVWNKQMWASATNGLFVGFYNLLIPVGFNWSKLVSVNSLKLQENWTRKTSNTSLEVLVAIAYGLFAERIDIVYLVLFCPCSNLFILQFELPNFQFPRPKSIYKKKWKFVKCQAVKAGRFYGRISDIRTVKWNRRFGVAGTWRWSWTFVSQIGKPWRGLSSTWSLWSLGSMHQLGSWPIGWWVVGTVQIIEWMGNWSIKCWLLWNVDRKKVGKSSSFCFWGDVPRTAELGQHLLHQFDLVAWLFLLWAQAVKQLSRGQAMLVQQHGIAHLLCRNLRHEPKKGNSVHPVDRKKEPENMSIECLAWGIHFCQCWTAGFK